MKAFRCQLPQVNPFYPEECNDDDILVSAEIDVTGPSLCCVCGALAVNKCGRCKLRPYCSRKHQVEHWKHGHKEECNSTAATTSTGTYPAGQYPSLWPELELTIETEPDTQERVAFLRDRVSTEKVGRSLDTGVSSHFLLPPYFFAFGRLNQEGRRVEQFQSWGMY